MRDFYRFLIIFIASMSLIFMVGCDEGEDEETASARYIPQADDDDADVPIGDDDANDDVDDDTETDDDTNTDDDTDDDADDDVDDDADDDTTDTTTTTTTTPETTTTTTVVPTTTTTTTTGDLFIEMIDDYTETHSVSGYVSYKIDDAGSGHVSYFVGEGPYPHDWSIVYRNENARGWTEAEVVVADFAYSFSYMMIKEQKISMDIDDNGYIHVAYFDHDTLKLGYATNRTGSWITLTPDVPDMVGLYPTLAIAADGKAHISSMKYDDDTGPDLGLYYITFDGSTWTSEQAWEYPMFEPGLVLDQSGVPHISAGGDPIGYGILTGDTWTLNELFIDDHFFGQMTSLTLDGNDAAHISCQVQYFTKWENKIMYLTDAGGQWEYQMIDDIDVTYSHPFNDIAVAPDTSAHIAYFYTYYPRQLKYASNKSGVWENTTIDERDDEYSCGFTPTVAVHPNGMVHTLYICKGLKRAIFPQGYTGE